MWIVAVDQIVLATWMYIGPRIWEIQDQLMDTIGITSSTSYNIEIRTQFDYLPHYNNIKDLLEKKSHVQMDIIRL